MDGTSALATNDASFYECEVFVQSTRANIPKAEYTFTTRPLASITELLHKGWSNFSDPAYLNPVPSIEDECCLIIWALYQGLRISEKSIRFARPLVDLRQPSEQRRSSGLKRS